MPASGSSNRNRRVRNNTRANTRKRKPKASTKVSHRLKRGWIRWLMAAPLFAGLMFIILKLSVPSIDSLRNYSPPQVTKLYSDDGHLVGELFTEKRTVIPFEDIPPYVVHAFLAAEDEAFYEHRGLDYPGILRAILKNLRPGAHRQGASTITQQLVKNLLVGNERTLWRKAKEMVLARDVDQNFDKDQILYLYLNHIYFGAGAYGVEEACQTYFAKSVRDISLAEAAYLASVPKDPNYRTLYANPEASKRRQIYVLEQMLENGWADPVQANQAIQAPILKPAWPEEIRYADIGGYYVEWARRYLVEQYGEDAVLHGGLRVYLGMEAAHQQAAQQSLRRGLEQFAQKTGALREPALHIEAELLESTLEALNSRHNDRVRNRQLTGASARRRYIWDLRLLTEDDLHSAAQISARSRLMRLQTETELDALIVHVDARANVAWADLGSAWARIDPTAWLHPNAGRSGVASVLQKGDVVRIWIQEITTRKHQGKPVLIAKAIPRPDVQGALVSIDPYSRRVTAMVGGYEHEGLGLNRAVQSHRQPGSAFKPIIYLTALQQKAITAADTCPDAPVTIRDPWTGEDWRPKNYSGRFDGNILFRQALTRSKNTCSVRLVDKIGVEAVIKTAKALGIESKMPKSLSIALGAGDVTPLELANAYATIASQGLYAKPILIKRVVAADGTLLERHQPYTEQRIDAAAAYVLTDMMKAVIEQGTAKRASILNRPLAGKTGTTNQSRNVWFSGFSPQLVSTVWVGFDNNEPLGRATGSSTALPIWIRFMGRALANVEPDDFGVPEGVVRYWVDANSGLLSEENEHSLELAFIEGTEPNPTVDELDDPFLLPE